MKSESNLLQHYNQHPKYNSIINPLVVTKIFKTLCVDMPKNKRVLDLGCGNGQFCSIMKTFNNYVVGVDYSYVRIMCALKKTEGRIPLTCSKIQDFLLSHSDLYHVVTLFDTLEHLEEPAAVVNEARKKLLATGVVIAAIPLDMEYVAHIQVFDEARIREELKPDRLEVFQIGRPYAICLWS